MCVCVAAALAACLQTPCYFSPPLLSSTSTPGPASNHHRPPHRQHTAHTAPLAAVRSGDKLDRCAAYNNQCQHTAKSEELLKFVAGDTSPAVDVHAEGLCRQPLVGELMRCMKALPFQLSCV